MADINEALGTDLLHNGDLAPTPSGDLERISGLANLKQALLHRLITIKGTLAHRPGYGVGITRYQGAPNSFTAQQRISSDIMEQFPLDPRVLSVTSVSILSPADNPTMTKISVSVIPVGYTETQMTFLPFSGGV